MINVKNLECEYLPHSGLSAALCHSKREARGQPSTESGR